MSLLNNLIAARDQYYATGESPYSDDEYDALREHLIQSGADLSNLAPPPKLTEWPVVSHVHRMESIERTVTKVSDLAGLSGVGFTTLKYDGLSIELVYNGGTLVGAILRGDGDKGENVYHNISRFGNLPTEIPQWRSFQEVCVYGEVVVSRNNLAALNEQRELNDLPPYKSPRNAVSMVRSLSLSVSAARSMTVKPFTVRAPGLSENQAEQIAFLKATNVDLPFGRKFDIIDVVPNHTPQAAFESLGKASAMRSNMAFQIDGLVWRSLDGTMVKFKFPPDAAVTRVTRVVEQLGRTGIVTPVCEFEPVTLVEASVRRATVHNSVLVHSKLAGLGPGAMVLVSRRGDVIPHVESVISPSETPWQPSDTCPSCGSAVEAEGSVRRCSADPGSCSGTVVGSILKFVKEQGIEGFGPSIVNTLVASGLVEVPSDLYRLDPMELANTEMIGGSSLGEKTAFKLIESVAGRFKMTWGELLGSISIPGCAKSLMADVASVLDPESLRKASYAELSAIPGVGPTRAASIGSFVETRWDEVIAPLLDVVQLVDTAGPLRGMTICITLGLSMSRTEMESLIRLAGGQVKGSVSSKVTHVVCNTPDASSSKLAAAKKLGLPILSEAQILSMMGNHAELEPEIHDEDAF